ncbi:MAG TPA: glycerophosphodiester phosphodiesterase family protein [Kofleriaceae bacterium]|jgi:glycerophosphoryl diester phosphodiesterase|nr:glycerophosphodiester phosphodiesterase family protein [Kofleriaceae bacterium]
MHPRRLYAHRGASAERPENTLSAFERAVEIGIDALEMDVHVTRDNHLIVAHDDTATRTCGAQLVWAELDLAEVRRLDAGWGFVAPDGTRPFAGKAIGVPTFEQVLDAFPAMRINVDLKGDRAVALMLDLVRARRAEDRITLASFQLATLVEVRRRGYGGETALSQPEVAALLALPAMVWRQLPFTGTAAQVPVHAGRIRFDRATFIAKCHSIGLRVDFWTVDDPDEAARLLALGADGIMTNHPLAVQPVVWPA